MSDHLSDEQMEQVASTLATIPSLTYAQYNAAVDAAKARTAQDIPEPVRQVVKAKSEGDYPRSVKRIVLGLAALVFINLTVISIAKQLSPISKFIEPLAPESHWLARIILTFAMATFTEMGALLFEIAGSIIRNRRMSLVAWAFAVFAVIGNVYGTIQHQVEYEGIAVLVWYITIAAPALILALGTLFKNLVLQSIKERQEKRLQQEAFDAEYEKSKADYVTAVAKAEEHPLYLRRYLPLAILDVIRRASSRTRDLLEAYPFAVNYVIYRELERFTADYVQPTLPAPRIVVETVRRSRPKLSSGQPRRQLNAHPVLSDSASKEMSGDELRTKATEYLDSHPDAANLSVRGLLDTLNAVGIPIRRTMTNEVQSEWKRTHQGGGQ